MADVAVDLVHSLPTVLWGEILSMWLDVRDLVRLDSAYCAHRTRPALHALFELPEFVCSLNYIPMDCTAWLLKKRIRICDFVARTIAPIDLFTEYLRFCGRCIQSVTLTGSISDALVEAIVACCPNVHVLHLNEMVNASFEPLRKFPNIAELNVLYSTFTQSRSDTTIQLNVRKLMLKCFSGWGNVIDDILSVVSKCPCLTHFSLEGGYGFPTQTAAEMLSKLTGLVALNLGELSIDDAAMAVIVTHCSSLKHLDLDLCYELTDSGMYTIATSLKLQSIALPCNAKLTDKSLEHLQHCAHTLKFLYIRHSFGIFNYANQITQSAVHALLCKAHNCQHTWSSCIQDHNNSIGSCAYATNICIATSTTDSLLLDIAQHSKQLRTLDLYTCSTTYAAVLTSVGLYAIINGCPLIQKISIHPHWDTTSFAEVLRTHPQLFSRTRVREFDVMNMI